jgi:hypothetical protein
MKQVNQAKPYAWFSKEFQAVDLIMKIDSCELRSNILQTITIGRAIGHIGTVRKQCQT